MLARVTGGKSGIVNYLIDGIKSGRELDRDQLDKRICLEGNLNLTDEIIMSMDSSENYLHITLSFNEKNITSEQIEQVYCAYRDKLLNAYDREEYNIYAEIHQPKIKSYQDKKTGEMVERFPHVHIVLPKKNLVTGKAFNPFGLYSDSVKYHDSIQESINRGFNLSSPYDSQRPISFEGNAKFLSRYKGDTFKGANVALKSQVLDLIVDKKLSSKTDLVNELSKIGKVSFGKAGSNDEYIKFMPSGGSRNVRLTEACFSDSFLERRELKREKPSDKEIGSLVNEWVNTVSHEKKFIHSASPKLRKEYYSLNATDREGFLNECRNRFRNEHFPTRGRAANIELSLKRNGSRTFANIANGLPSLPERSLARSQRGRKSITEGILPSNEKHNLDATRSSRGSELRRASVGRLGGRISSFEGFKVNASIKSKPNKAEQIKGRVSSFKGFKINVSIKSRDIKAPIDDKPLTLAENLLSEHKDNALKESELKYFRILRRELKADNLLDSLVLSHGINKDDYSVFTAKDGSQRIRSGTIGFNVSDFCTKHMQMSWTETKGILTDSYRNQLENKRDRNIVNSITFASRYVTQGYKSASKIDRLNESVMILKRLQKLEKQGANDMLSTLERFKDKITTQNSISVGSETSLEKSFEQIKRSRELAEKLDFKISDIVARKDLKNGKVEFHDFHSGNVAFTDVGNRIIFNDKEPDVGHIAAAMAIASEKFGVLKISGTKEFKQQLIDVAVAKNLRVVFDDKQMQSDFLKARDLRDNAPKNEQKLADNDDKNAITNGANEAREAKEVEKEDKFIVNYKFDNATKKVELEINGKHPSTIEPELLDKIKDNDAFLKNYSSEEVQNGTLDLDKAPQSVPFPRIYDDKGQFVTPYTVQDDKPEAKQEATPTAKQETTPTAKQETYIVTYKFDSESSKLDLQINGKHPTSIKPSVLDKIAKADPFLKNFTKEEVQTGKLALDKAGTEQPAPRTYSSEGVAIKIESNAQEAPKMKM